MKDDELTGPFFAFRHRCRFFGAVERCLFGGLELALALAFAFAFAFAWVVKG